MFKRLLWLTIGMALGFGASFWLMRFVRETVARLSPELVADDLATALRRLGGDLKAALDDGRAAMRAREAELREEFAGRPSR